MEPGQQGHQVLPLGRGERGEELGVGGFGQGRAAGEYGRSLRSDGDGVLTAVVGVRRTQYEARLLEAIATGKPDLYERWLRELWQLRAAGTLRTAVHEEIPLAEASRAHALIEQRRNLGKVVLVP
ncbi:zinc-binding dehydrogenase [Streptomyces virginiae]|uniref:zinc-binding dehydrogenase n=1 Tax=Streptomyces virginiae TaxID=1961 RepID=UPI002B1DE594|nr:zinc-binding dehydrogenase [Streptomyces virginiae]